MRLKKFLAKALCGALLITGGGFSTLNSKAADNDGELGEKASVLIEEGKDADALAYDGAGSEKVDALLDALEDDLFSLEETDISVESTNSVNAIIAYLNSNGEVDSDGGVYVTYTYDTESSVAVGAITYNSSNNTIRYESAFTSGESISYNGFDYDIVNNTSSNMDGGVYHDATNLKDYGWEGEAAFDMHTYVPTTNLSFSMTAKKHEQATDAEYSDYLNSSARVAVALWNLMLSDLMGVSAGDAGFEEYEEALKIKYADDGAFAVYQGYEFYKDAAGDVRCYDTSGNRVINDFKCDGTYTYYFQADGTAMKDRLTYHPDGVHVIYFDKYGHEVFSDFANVRKSIAGDPVDDYCFFDIFGYLYVDVLTYDKLGVNLYYANPYGVLERNGWFTFSNSVTWPDGQACGMEGKTAFANSDGTLSNY